MGRRSTGIRTTGEVERLEISDLLKNGRIKTGFNISGLISWTNGNSIRYKSELNEERHEIRLIYANTGRNGEVNKLDYIIQLTSISSNFGKGRIWYFVCPVTGKKARILYKCYGSLYFKSRESYQQRIYYSCQKSSKLDFDNDRYWEIKRKLENLYPLIRKKHYQGKETKLNEKIRRMEEKREFHDRKRWFSMPMSLRKAMKFSNQNQ